MAWAIATAALLGAVGLRMMLEPYLGDSVAFVTLFAAVAVAAWMFGPRIALMFALFGYFACHFLFAEPRDVFFFQDARAVAGMVTYAVTSALIVAIGESMRSAQDRAHARGEMLRVTLGNIEDAVIATDVDSTITYLNERAEVLTGWSCLEALGKPLDAVFRLVDNDLDDSVVPAPARARASSAYRAVLAARDNVARPIEHSAAPIKGSDGLIAGCVVTFRDICERASFEREAAERARAFRLLDSIVDASDDAIISASLEGVVQSWNGSAERALGYAAQEMIGQPMSRIIPPDRLDKESGLMLAALEASHRIEHFETERVHKSGRRVPVSLTISPVLDPSGTVVGTSTIARDNTRQRAIAQRERALLRQTAAANERFHAFLDQSALFVVLMQVSGMVLEPSRHACESCGYRRDQIVGKLLWDCPWWTRSPVLAEPIRLACEHAARGHRFRATLPYFVDGGTERLADVSIVGIKDGQGELLYLALTAVDITERKRPRDDSRREAAPV